MASREEADQGAGHDTGQDAAASASAPAPAKKAKFPCIRCKKNVTKNSKSVKCATCELWVHVDCEQISPELFNILSNPEKYGGTGIMWNCECCMASVARLQLIVAEVQKNMRDVVERVKGTEGAIADHDRRIGTLESAAAATEDRVDGKVKMAEANVLDELEDREARRLNLVFHGVGECPADAAAGAERIEWDKASCENIFRELCLGTTVVDVKFCRRLGERREGPRPLLVGFFNEAEKINVLRHTPRLISTKFSEVQVVPDLTKTQRERENKMREEMHRRNAALPEEDRAKNLEWAVVGARGERRLIKTTARVQRPQGSQNAAAARGAPGGRGRGMVARGAAATRGAPHPTRGTNRGTGRGARAATRGGTQPQVHAQAADQMEVGGEEEEEEEEEDEEEYPRLRPTEAPRGRRGSKRGAESQEEGTPLEGRPPEKR